MYSTHLSYIGTPIVGMNTHQKMGTVAHTQRNARLVYICHFYYIHTMCVYFVLMYIRLSAYPAYMLLPQRCTDVTRRVQIIPENVRIPLYVYVLPGEHMLLHARVTSTPFQSWCTYHIPRRNKSLVYNMYTHT